MADLTPQDMAANLLASGFERNGPSAAALSDPIADTPMVVTLDQLRPYDHDPRVTRNPAYEDIKASIRERGLDAPPAITRRPGEPHYIIRNGGNTRLAILRELWSETKDEQFFRIPCLFRPWPQRGEVVMLTGHLAENELRGGLSFIERALGVEKAREFYEQESGQALSQSELARRLTADGFPLPQSHISRMQDAVHYLLPAIPTLLYGGLGRHQVERLAVLRKACERTWERRALGRNLSMDFATLFQDVLVQFDTQPDNFSPQRVQDELVGQMAELLEADYDTLAGDRRHGEPPACVDQRSRAVAGGKTCGTDRARTRAAAATVTAFVAGRPTVQSSAPRTSAPAGAGLTAPAVGAEGSQQDGGLRDERLQGHIVSPAPTTERLQSIQRMVADQMGDKLPDFEADALRAIPAGGWALPHLGRLVHRARPGRAGSAAGAHRAVRARDRRGSRSGRAGRAQRRRHRLRLRGAPAVRALPPFARAVLTLLHALCAAPRPAAGLDGARLADDLAALLHGGGAYPRLSDAGLVKLFRLLRLARRLLDLETGAASSNPGHGA